MKLQFRRRTDVQAVLPSVQRQFVAGRVIAYPTETLYGLGAGLHDAGLDAINAVKGREGDKPLILLVSSMQMVHQWGFEVPTLAERLARAFWPGPLTLVLSNRDIRLPRRLRGSSAGIGVRWTSHAGASALIDALGHPLISTSANPAGSPPALDADQVIAYFPRAVTERQIEVLDGGLLQPSPPSTVIDCTGRPRILREGAITRVELHPYLQG